MRWLETMVCLPKRDAGCLPAGAQGESPVAILPLGAFPPTRALFADRKLLAGGLGAGPSLVLAPIRPDGPALPRVAPAPDRQAGAISVQSVAAGAAEPGRLPTSALCVVGGAPNTPDSVLLYATGLGARREELEAALRQGGCAPRAGSGSVIHLGAAEPLLLAKGSSFETAYGDVLPPVASGASLLLRRSRVAWATRIFTHVKPQPRSVWTAVQPERTRASALHHAKRTAAELGLPPLNSLAELCRPPYLDVKELRQYRWRDPVTGKTCDAAEPLVGKAKRRVKPASATPDPDQIKKPRKRRPR